MRNIITSGWTVLALLLAGTYLLGFAATAMADDYPPNEGPMTEVPDKECLIQDGYGDYSCTHYLGIGCVAKNLDPNISGFCPDYPYVKYKKHRIYGYCLTPKTDSECIQWAKITCAQLAFYKTIDGLGNCSNPPLDPGCFLWVTIQNSCEPGAIPDPEE